MNHLKAAFLLIPIVVIASACSSIDNAIDCHTICQRYADCFSSSYDVSACESRCKDNSSKDSNYQNKVNTCDACIDDKSCTSATFTCASNCNGIVP
ncbi:hypothetical protein BH09MYX1_BH09MYX1_00070 [soil metagenome]